MTDEGRVALPDIRELLFADLPPLSALERFAAVPAMHALAQAVARKDVAASRAALEPLAGSPETQARLQAWSLARRMGIEPPAGSPAKT